ncbi:uncharacterized protein [Zea mays]|uniref:uncharacterized protein n=1 Tax=Zea mays TaxID=4577 RepID=UPI001652A27E|nr:uncharacterized protein LOC118476738 [Zea mays]
MESTVERISSSVQSWVKDHELAAIAVCLSMCARTPRRRVGCGGGRFGGVQPEEGAAALLHRARQHSRIEPARDPRRGRDPGRGRRGTVPRSWGRGTTGASELLSCARVGGCGVRRGQPGCGRVWTLTLLS